MANKYYSVDKSPYHTNCYFITTSEEVCKIITVLPKDNSFSYTMLQIALFGLEPDDFFKYIQIKYNAKILKHKNCIWKTITFTNLTDAWAFAKELEKRFTYCVENNFFKEINNAC